MKRIADPISAATDDNFSGHRSDSHIAAVIGMEGDFRGLRKRGGYAFPARLRARTVRVTARAQPIADSPKAFTAFRGSPLLAACQLEGRLQPFWNEEDHLCRMDSECRRGSEMQEAEACAADEPARARGEGE